MTTTTAEPEVLKDAVAGVLAELETPTDAAALALAQRRNAYIDEPGIHAHIPSREYHGDPVIGGSLSSTGARRILPPGSPARFDYDRRHGQLATPAMDFGTAVHTILFGSGPEVTVIEAPDRRTKDVKQKEETARKNGAIPLLEHEFRMVEAMVKAVRTHPDARLFFDIEDAQVEHSLFWRDQDGLMCRARPDLMILTRYGRRVIVDYKSCHSIDDRSLSRAMWDKGYHQQNPWYVDGAIATGLGDEDTDFVFLCQEKKAPYFVRCFRPDPDALHIGRELNKVAKGLYQECTEQGRWPAYSNTIDSLPLPSWVMNAYNRERW